MGHLARLFVFGVKVGQHLGSGLVADRLCTGVVVRQGPDPLLKSLGDAFEGRIASHRGDIRGDQSAPLGAGVECILEVDRGPCTAPGRDSILDLSLVALLDLCVHLHGSIRPCGPRVPGLWPYCAVEQPRHRASRGHPGGDLVGEAFVLIVGTADSSGQAQAASMLENMGRFVGRNVQRRRPFEGDLFASGHRFASHDPVGAAGRGTRRGGDPRDVVGPEAFLDGLAVGESAACHAASEEPVHAADEPGGARSLALALDRRLNSSSWRERRPRSLRRGTGDAAAAGWCQLCGAQAREDPQRCGRHQ